MLRYIFTVLFTTLIVIKGIATPINQDSLYRVSKTGSTDTARLRAYIELHFQQQFQKNLSKKSIDSIYILSKNNNFHYGVVKCLMVYGIRAWLNGQTDSSLKYFYSCLDYGIKNHYQYGIFKGYQNIVVPYLNNGMNDSAKKYLNLAVKSFKPSFGQINLAKLYLDLGITSLYDSRYKDAVDYLQKTILIAEKSKDTIAQSQAYGVLGNLYKELGNFDKSNLYLRKQLSTISPSTLGGRAMGMGYLNLGNLYESIKNDPDSGIYYLNQSLQIAEKIGYGNLVSGALINIGNCYVKKKDFPKAEALYRKALSMKESIENRKSYSGLLINLGNCLIKRNKLDSARILTIKGLALAVEFEALLYQASAYENLFRIDTLQGNYKTGLSNLLKKIKIDDSIQNTDLKNKLIELSLKYDFDKIEFENNNLKQSNDLNQVIIRKQKLVLLLGILVIICFIVLLSWIEYSRRRFIRLNHELKKKNKEIEARDSEIAEKNNHLEILNQTKDKFFSIISHDLRSPFNLLIGFSTILDDNYHDMTDAERIQKISKLRKTSEHTFDHLENLLTWSKAQRKLLSPAPQQFSLNKLTVESIVFIQEKAAEKEQNLLLDIADDLYVYADPNFYRSIIQNVVNNAVKFTDNKGTITVKAMLEKDFIAIETTDNGIGMPQALISELFKIHTNVKRNGTNKESGAGLGLIICKELVEISGGTIYVKSEEAKGTSITFTLPAKQILNEE
jgi:signal transduction histidine kinase/Tfp pilus assembly protein PilF